MQPRSSLTTGTALPLFRPAPRLFLSPTGIVLPLVGPLAQALGGGSREYLLHCIGSCLGGATFGNICSPISDTTILTAPAAEVAPAPLLGLSTAASAASRSSRRGATCRPTLRQSRPTRCSPPRPPCSSGPSLSGWASMARSPPWLSGSRPWAPPSPSLARSRPPEGHTPACCRSYTTSASCFTSVACGPRSTRAGGAFRPCPESDAECNEPE